MNSLVRDNSMEKERRNPGITYERETRKRREPFDSSPTIYFTRIPHLRARNNPNSSYTRSRNPPDGPHQF